MTLILMILVLLLSFYLMAKLVDEYFIASLDKISTRFKMSNDAAGATLMAMGSSAPELFISIISLVKPGDHASIGLGTIVGSALFNILVISGVSSMVREAKLSWQPVLRDVIFYGISVLLLIATFMVNNTEHAEITVSESSLLVIWYVLYVFAVVRWRKILPYKDLDVIDTEEIEEPKTGVIGFLTRPVDKALAVILPSPEKYFRVFTISIVLIAALSWAMVESAVIISHILDIPEAIIALTVLAAGTSIPDLISSVFVAKQGRGGMAISNAFGSNIFDILVGLGIPWMITIFISGQNVPVLTKSLVNSSIMLFASLIVVFIVIVINKWKVGKFSGGFFLLLYVAYLAWEIGKQYF